MKRNGNLKKRFNYRYLLCILITIVILSLFLIFPNSLKRLLISFKNFGTSIGYYFCELLRLPHNINPSVIQVPTFGAGGSGSGSSGGTVIIPSTQNLFDIKMSMYFKSLINGESWVIFFLMILNGIAELVRYVLIFLPIAILIYFLYKRYFKENDKATNEDSKELKCFKWFERNIYIKIKTFIIDFIDFLKKHKYIYIVWSLIFALYFNFYSIIIDFVSFYLYFIVSFNVGNIYIQVYKLCLDLLPMFKFFPIFVWLILFLVIFHQIRKNLGYKKLMHFEMKNRGFINSLPQVLMYIGTMGTGKTTTITDIALSQSIIFRDKAFELLKESDMQFPNFPYSVFEKEIKLAINYFNIYNLATAKKWIRKKRLKFRKLNSIKRCFGYDYEKYGLYYDSGLEMVYLWDMLENYVQLYFIYVVQTSLVVSNYSIREDYFINDIGNFPLWDTEIFKKKSNEMSSQSYYSHILDFDMMRLGKKVVEFNKKRNCLEFGVVVVSEVGKERGNQIENKSFKKDDKKSNPLNDLFNLYLKMVRHSATVCNYSFIKVLFDEQRAESLGADAKDLCYVNEIIDKSERKNVLMFFGLEEKIFVKFYKKFSSIYYNYRYYRGDNTLFIYLLKRIMGVYYSYYDYMKNIFSYNVQTIMLKKGGDDTFVKEQKYYIAHKKIYSKRFVTDCFSDFFFEKAIGSKIGLADLESFKSERATLEEMKKYNSRFINELLQNKDK